MTCVHKIRKSDHSEKGNYRSIGCDPDCFWNGNLTYCACPHKQRNDDARCSGLLQSSNLLFLRVGWTTSTVVPWKRGRRSMSLFSPSISRFCFCVSLLALLALNACSPSAWSRRVEFLKSSQEECAGTIEYLPNDDSAYLLAICRAAVPPGNPLQPVRFQLYDYQEGVIILEDSLDNGRVAWISPNRIVVSSMPEVVSEGESTGSGYLFDVRTRSRLPLPARQDAGR
jgi:hypothetical protein